MRIGFGSTPGEPETPARLRVELGGGLSIRMPGASDAAMLGTPEALAPGVPATAALPAIQDARAKR